jgi:tetratricopeptide (TPR) repeat protein
MRCIKLALINLLLLSTICLTVNVQSKGNLEKVLQFDEDADVYALVNNKDENLLVYYTKLGGVYYSAICWYQNGKKVKNIENPEITRVRMSPDGNYYSFIVDEVIYINNKDDKTIIKIPSPRGEDLDWEAWTLDSKAVYFCENGTPDIIYSYDVTTGILKKILNSNRKNQYFHVVTVNDPHVIYLLKSNSDPESPAPSCDILQYNLVKKTVQTVKLPYIKSLRICWDFSISPDERFIIFGNMGDDCIYVIDKEHGKVIDKIQAPADTVGQRQGLCYFSWKPDSSYVVFTMTGHEIYKYTVPPLAAPASSSQGQEQLLTLDYAKKIHQLPGGKELSSKEQQEQITQANSLSEEGFAFYKSHNDAAAIAKYEEALTHYATAEIYYRYGNSLSNIPRLEDAIKAYQIAIELNYDKSYLVYYNIACSYSRLKKSKDAFANLELAINKGYNKFGQIQKDTDLAYLRSLPEWKDWWGKHQK